MQAQLWQHIAQPLQTMSLLLHFHKPWTKLRRPQYTLQQPQGRHLPAAMHYFCRQAEHLLRQPSAKQVHLDQESLL